MPLTQTEFNGWAGRHGAMFGFNHPNDGAMFVRWFDCFSACSYSVADLDGATSDLARRTEPLKWRDDHLAAIHGSVKVRRESALKRWRQDKGELGDDQGTCTLCGNTGRVEVPMPRQIRNLVPDVDSEAYGCTATVICRCSKGRRIEEDHRHRNAVLPEDKQKKRSHTIDEYEREICPGWRQVMAEWERIRLSHFEAQRTSQQTDELAGPIAAVLRQAKERLTP